MRLSEHLFVRDPQPLEMLICLHCGYPDFACACNPEEEELPPYRGADPTLYVMEKQQ